LKDILIRVYSEIFRMTQVRPPSSETTVYLQPNKVY